MDPLYFEALAALETAGGRKTIKGPKGEDSFNLYNIKDFSGSGKGFRAHDKAEGSNDAYRVYASAAESTQDLIGLLSRKYPKALEATNREQFAVALQKGGYASDPDYVAKFVSVYDRLAGTGGARPAEAPGSPVAAPQPPQAGRSLADLYMAAQGPRQPPKATLTQTAKAIRQLAAIAPLKAAASDTPADWYTRASDDTVAEAQRVKEAKAQGVLDISRAVFMSTALPQIAQRLFRPQYEPDGFVATEDDLAGFNMAEQDALREPTSRREYEHVLFDIQDHKDRMIDAGKSGIGWAMIAHLIAGAPEGLATGGVGSLALARSMWSAAKLAKAGRSGAATAVLAAENVGLNLALTGAQDLATPFVGMQDYVIGGIGGVIGMGANAPRVFRGATDAEEAALKSILDDAYEGKQADLSAARGIVGNDADPKAVAQVAGEIQAARVRAELDAHTSELGADRQLISGELNDELFGEDALAEGIDGPNRQQDFPSLSSGADTAAQAGLPSESWVNLPHTGQGVLSDSLLRPGQLAHTGNNSAEHLDLKWRRDDPDGAREIANFERDYGVSYEGTLQAAPPRSVSFVLAEALSPPMRKVALWMQKTFLPDLRVVVMDMDATPLGRSLDANARGIRGDAWNIGRDISVIRVRASDPKWQHTMIHEFGHIVLDRGIAAVTRSARDGLTAVYDAWLKRYSGAAAARPAKGLSRATDAAVRRGPLASDVVLKTLGVDAPAGFIPSLMDVIANVVGKLSPDIRRIDAKQLDAATLYIPAIKEFGAEQFVKYIEAAVADVLDWKPATMPEAVTQFFAGLWQRFAKLFNTVKQAGLIAPEQGVVDFFEQIRKGVQASQARRGGLDAGRIDARNSFDADTPIESSSAMMSTAGPASRSDADISRDYGLDVLAGDSAVQRAVKRAMVALYRKAEAYPMPDMARISKLLSSKAMQWAAPTALRLLNSGNPVARMVAIELLESGSGAAGRRTTAALAKWIHEREFMGNAINDVQRHYVGWRNANGGNKVEDHFGGTKWEQFNRKIATELEDRAAGRSSTAAPAVRDAADVLSAAYDRMRIAQQRLKTPGWAALPESSIGYMPHRMNAGKVRAMTPDQARVVHGVLAEQFEQIEGFDAAFSATLASKYLDIMRKRGSSGYGAPVGIRNAEAADIVEQSAAAMGMSRDEARALAKRVLRAAPAHTRRRLRLDLTRSYEADGQPFQLLDLFETDQLGLLRSQASRVSGEAALVRHGIMGSSGLSLLRQAMEFGAAGGKADNNALEAFDQVAAEFLGTPFGTHSRWLDRAVQFNALASLGGIGFNQLAETLNGAITLGVRHALAAVGSFGRLRAEIIALSKGQRVHNPIIGSIETYGAEFGTDSYKLVFPFDMPDKLTQTYGVETVTAADRLLRSGAHLQGKLSLWRAISSAQQRGMAEQIVHKALRYIREGKSDVALADMGIDRELIGALRAELPAVAKFDAQGRLVEFDITKLQNRGAADAFVQAVHRGTQQIIQGTFIGETGKWAHSGLLKLLTQFRTFSLIAVDKQWNRQVGNHGTAKALGLLLGTMSFAAPIYMIRAGVNSIGREDQDEYLEKHLSPANIAKQTLNYVALSGLAGDLLDALSAVSGVQPSGGRSGHNKSFVGNVIAPAAGKADDIWGALQNSKEGTDIHGLMKELPFAKLPWLYPAMNSLKPE